MKIAAESHVDHALTHEQLEWLTARFVDRRAFFIETVELPVSMGTVPCGLHGPLAGDQPVPESEVVYQTRGDRKHPSRMVARPPRPTRTVTVIAGPHGEEPCILYTAFGGPLTPKEPGDPTLTPEQRAESERIWALHALSL